MPMGTFTQKTAGQPDSWISTPPTIGPAPNPRPATLAQMPIAVVRHSGGYFLVDQDAGPAERRHDGGARALQPAVEDQRGVAPGQRAGRGEDREDREADEEEPLAAVPVAERPAENDERRQRENVRIDRPLEIPGLTRSPRWMAGRATFTIVLSSRIIPCPMHIATSVRRSWRAPSWLAGVLIAQIVRGGLGACQAGRPGASNPRELLAQRPV